MLEGAARLLEARYGLAIRRAGEGALPGPLLVGQGLGMHSCSGVVLRDHFLCCQCRIGKTQVHNTL